MARAKKKAAKGSNVSDLQAVMDYKNSKQLTIHDLKVIKPLTTPQSQMMESYFQGLSIFATGSAGTGKSLVSLYLALNDLLQKNSTYKKIKIIRSIVPSRDIGYLPGDIEEKIEVYETPYKEIFTFLFDRPTSYEKFKDLGKVEFMPTSFLRGQTWDDSIIVVDEVQNLNFQEINTVMTRVGTNSKIFLLGDSFQTDLYKNSRDKSGIESLEKILPHNKFFDTIHFTRDDIVRSEFVKSWLSSVEELTTL